MNIRKMNHSMGLIIIMLFSALSLTAQNSAEAVKYLNEIAALYQQIEKDTWDYTSAMVHSRSARKVERNRVDLLKTIDRSIQTVKRMPAFEKDYSLRDSVVVFLRLYFNVINHDYEKIVNMEEIAEQSYDLMEAYLLAQEEAGKKLEMASDIMATEYTNFADKNSIRLIENADKTSQKLKKSSEALSYYNKVYLIFFKAYKQEIYMIEAMNNKDINAIEQNRNALKNIATEGLKKLNNHTHFKGDNSLITSCKKVLEFYKDEAGEDMEFITEFIVQSNEYEQMVKLFESKDRMLLTKEEVDRYNSAINNYNKGINKYNSTNNSLNTQRNNCLNAWNNSVGSFMARNVPKK